MEACMRGFSFMPESTVERGDLKYVESVALERTWRTTRRERLKQQEQRIWEEFVKEEDILDNICNEDPYQFLNQLPEVCIKELLDLELQKLEQEKAAEVHIEEEPTRPGLSTVEVDNQHTVTIDDKEQCDMSNIFDDDKEEDVSGPEEEDLNDSIGSPPCTVREIQTEGTELTADVENQSPDKISGRSSEENLTNMFEGSVYCAKVKDIRLRINDALLDILDSLERKDIVNLDPSDVPKMTKRSVEFCARFNRVHVYQLQRQVGDIERNSSNALPFAQHTHFQAQLVRVSSLHQNLLHALQVFHKSISQTACMKESGDLLLGMLQLTGQASRVCDEARPPALAAASDLFNDGVQSTCDKLKETVNEYAKKMSDYLNSVENTTASCSRKSSEPRGRKWSKGTWSRSGTKSKGRDMDARLSMYSLATLNAKSSCCKDNHSISGTSTMQASTSGRGKPASNNEVPSHTPKKSARSRRPLMRGPQQHARRPVPRDHDIRTLVESVAPCTSTHISREASPFRSTKNRTTTSRQRSKETTPRTLKLKETSRIPLNNTPRNKMASPTLTKHPNSPKTIVQNRENIVCSIADHGSPKLKQALNKCVTEDSNVNVKEKDESLACKKMETNCKQMNEESKKSERNKNKAPDLDPSSCEVTRLVRQLCAGDNTGRRGERVTGTRNAQLVCISGGSPRQPSTPQLLRILEETIQKKAPKSLFPKQTPVKDAERYRMTFNIPERVTESLYQYRTKFVQHMLASSMYANSAVGKPWEKIGSVSDQIIDDLLLNCAKEMELQQLVKEIYKNETR